MHRIPTLVLALALVLGTACAAFVGAADPIRQEDLASLDASSEASARAAAISFLRAYVHAPRDGIAPLLGLVGPRRMRAWAHWYGVQLDSFPGTQSGELRLTSVSGTQPIPIADQPGDLVREVELEADAVFHFDPDGDDPFDVTRVMSGPMRLFQVAQGRWVVLDFLRDGVPLSSSFQVLPKSTSWDVGGRVTVRLDSFVSVPAWQFDVVVRVRRGSPVGIGPEGVELVDADGKKIHAGVVTGALLDVHRGAAVEGIASFPLQPSAEGLTLRLTFDARDRLPPLQIKLADLIDPVPTASPSQSPAAG
jgi:hypothetical protein